MLGIKDRNESHIRLYTRNTPEWNLLGWHAQLLYLGLLRHTDTDGTIPYRGKTRWEILEFITGIPMKFITVAVRDLVRDGWLVKGDHAWTVTNYAVTASRAPSTAMTGAERARQFRQRRKAERMAMEEVLRRGTQADGSIKIRRFEFNIPPKRESTRVTVRNVTVVRPVASAVPSRNNQKPNGAKTEKAAIEEPATVRDEPNVNSSKAPSEKQKDQARDASRKGPPLGPPSLNSFKNLEPETVEDRSRAEKREETLEILREFSLARKTLRPRSRDLSPTPKIVESIKKIRKETNATLQDFRDAIWGQFEQVQKNIDAFNWFCPESLFRNARNFGMARSFGDGSPTVERARLWAMEKAKPREEQLVFFGKKNPVDDRDARQARFNAYVKEIYREEQSSLIAMNLEETFLGPWLERLDLITRLGTATNQRTVGQEMEPLAAMLPPKRNLAQYAIESPPTESKVAEMARGFLDKLNNKRNHE